MTLEGPPGTGKTTTVTVLLEDLYTKKTRTLVCAPSNKAVQVLASRFYKDHPDSIIVFTGVESKLQDDLRPIYLNETCKDFKKHWKHAHDMFVDSLYEELFSRYHIRDSTVCDTSVDDLQERAEAILRLFAVDQKGSVSLMNKYFRHLEPMLAYFECSTDNLSDRDHLGRMILNRAQIIFSTLSSSGGSMMLGMDEVDVLIVDEAGQSIEAETLIALQHNPRKVLLVGDTKQLPATVIYQHAEATNYDWSMMLRLTEKCGQPCSNMLSIQYRMHPDICQFPSQQYYGGALVTADAVHLRIGLSNGHLPYAIYDIGSGKDTVDGGSKRNVVEADYAVAAIKRIRSTDLTSSIGVITPYAAQKELVMQKCQGKAWAAGVRVSTVDGFQGDECDIIIVSFVRANGKNMVGFVKDARRLNVAITRPKHTLIVLCNAKVLEKGSSETKALIKNARERCLLLSETDLNLRLGLVTDNVVRDKTKKGNAKNVNHVFSQLSVGRGVASASSHSGPQPTA
eukprot:gene34721-42828_t